MFAHKYIDFFDTLSRFPTAKISCTICGRSNGSAKIDKKKKNHPSNWRPRYEARDSIQGRRTCRLYAFYFQIKVSIKLKSGILMVALNNLRNFPHVSRKRENSNRRSRVFCGTSLIWMDEKMNFFLLHFLEVHLEYLFPKSFTQISRNDKVITVFFK